MSKILKVFGVSVLLLLATFIGVGLSNALIYASIFVFGKPLGPLLLITFVLLSAAWYFVNVSEEGKK